MIFDQNVFVLLGHSYSPDLMAHLSLPKGILETLNKLRTKASYVQGYQLASFSKFPSLFLTASSLADKVIIQISHPIRFRRPGHSCAGRGSAHGMSHIQDFPGQRASSAAKYAVSHMLSASLIHVPGMWLRG